MPPVVWYLIVITWAIYCYSNVFFMFAPYMALKGFPSELTGILVGAFYAATTLIRPLGGCIVERLGIRRTLVASSALCAFAALFKFAASSFAPLLIIRLAMGCFYGIFVVALSTYQSLVIPEPVRGKAFAIISIGSLSCLFTVVPLAEWLLSRGAASLFLAIPVGMSALCALLSLHLPQVAFGNAPESGWGTWGELYRDTPFWRISTSCVLFGLCDASIVYLPALAIAMKLVPSSFMVGNGLGALAIRIAGREFFNSRQRYTFAGPSLLVMAVFLYLTTAASNNFWLFVCGVFYGFGMGYGYPAHLALTGDLAPVPLRAKSSSLVYFCNDISWFVLPVYVGFAAPYAGETGAFKLLALFCAVSGGGLTIMWTRYSRAGITRC
jgi:MFS family permease